MTFTDFVVQTKDDVLYVTARCIENGRDAYAVLPRSTTNPIKVATDKFHRLAA